MASCMMAPSHYLKQCGIITKLINKVLQHLSQWIFIKDLKIPISKMRLKLAWLDNFTPSPEIIHLCISDNSFICHGGNLISIVTIVNPSGLCLLKGNKVPSPCVFCDHTTGGNVPRKYLLLVSICGMGHHWSMWWLVYHCIGLGHHWFM